MSIRIETNPMNPGQYFACCGLLEVADRLWNGAEGWFEADRFRIEAAKSGASLEQLLIAARDFRLAEQGAASGGAEEGERDATQSLAIVWPVSLRLDWWKDTSLKTWAGSMDARRIFLALCHAIDPHHPSPFNQGRIVFDPQAKAVGARGRPSKQAKKREPFYFDARRGAGALSLDVGFSPDSLKLSTLAYPVVEALCLVGLQRCRPRPTRKANVFEYFLWHVPLLSSIAPAAVSGLIGEGDGYRFANRFRTDQRKHKAFMPATRFARSFR